MAKKPPLLAELAPGGVPDREVPWNCWQIAGHMERRRLRGPRQVRAQTAIVARHRASREHFEGCDPLSIEAELADEKESR